MQEARNDCIRVYIESWRKENLDRCIIVIIFAAERVIS